MTEEVNNIELIEQYCEGSLSKKEMIDFEARLIIDSELKEEFEIYKAVVSCIKEKGEEDFKVKLLLADEELDRNSKKTSSNDKSNFKYWAIAASIILLIGIGLYWILTPKIDLEKLADNYYEKEKGLQVEMSVNKGQLDNVMNSYKTEDYKGAKKQLEILLKTNNSNDTLNYFNGIINYELVDYITAKISFKKINKGSSYFEKAQYRLILIALKTKNKAEAIGMIDESLLNKNHIYYEKIKSLKAELSKQ